MTVKVSVVIAVHNPGKYLEDCVTGLLRQSLDPDDFEVFFVDDGSTDGTPARLDRLAAEHPHFHVIHQECSGWSGRPRNTGVDAARGEYVMFVDHDDWLGDEALERMYDYGTAHGADVVVGKMVGIGRAVPQELFRVNRPRATVSDAPLIDSLTPHKMFRRAFLDEHAIRFKEGRRRLEDHVFVAEAYLRAGSVAVLSDYPCYYHIARDDGSNAGLRRFDPVGYFGNLREALDVVESLTEPGALRDRLFSRWLRNEMVERMRGRRLLALPVAYAEQLYTEIHKVVTERFGPGVVAPLGLTQKVVAGLIFADRYHDIRAFAEWEARVRLAGALTALEWRDGALHLAFEAELGFGEGPLTFRREGRRALLELPLSADALDALDDQGIARDAPLSKTVIDLVVRHREDARRFHLPVRSGLHETPVGVAAFRQRISGSADLDPETAAFGTPLDRGIWDLYLRVRSCGWSKECRLGAVRGEDVEVGRLPALTGAPGRLVLPYWTDGPGNLSLDVDQHTDKLTAEVAAVMSPTAATACGAELRLPLPLHIAAAGGDPVRLRFEHRDAGRYPVDATVDGRTVTAGIPSVRLAGRRWALRLGVPSPSRGAPTWTRLPVDIVVDASGNAEVVRRRTPPRLPARRTRATRPVWRRLAGRVKRALTRRKRG